MGNVLRILLRDFKRLLKAPAALIVVGALLVLPSLYTWYNVVAFWNPYEATSGIRVCVVNQDAGTKNDMTGQLNVGDKLMEELQANDKLGWVTDEDYDTAMEDLKVGNVYAVYVIPEDFSACLVSPLVGNVKGPHIEYYANEKLGPVSPKVTDAAASTLEQTINSVFVSTVTEVATQAIDDAVAKAGTSISTAEKNASDRANEAKTAVDEARATLSGIVGTIDDARSKVVEAKDAIAGAYTLANDSRTLLQDVTDGAQTLQTGLEDLSSGLTPDLSAVLADLSQVTVKANALADAMATATGKAQADVDMVAANVQSVIDAMRGIASDLDAMAAKITDSKLKELMQEAARSVTASADEAQAVLDGIEALAERAGNASRAAKDAAQALSDAAARSSDLIERYASGLYGSATTSVNASVAQITSACSRLSAAMSSLDSAMGQLSSTFDQLDGVLSDCKNAVEQTNSLIGDVQTDLASVVADARMLAKSDMVANLLQNGTLNAENISEFMGSPTKLSTTKLYHPNAYGTAMAPLFMNLTFWIGAFMLVIICLLEVDSEGIEGLRPWQRYLGRFLMFCMFVVAQAVICCVGTLALGVQAANAPALFVAAAVAALAFLSIIYALSATFRHVGKGLCIVLVFAQIPGGSGLYPVEMTSSFFQAIYPMLPFTYGIDAMREAICGFYGNYFAHDLLVLGAFFFGSLAFGLLVGPLMSNVVRMTAREVYEGDLYNGEDALTPERPYRLAQMLRAITEKDSYRRELEERYARFSRRYPIFIRVSIVLGVGVPVLIGLLLALNAAEKVTLLTLFLIWLVLLIGFLVVMESQRFSFERQLNLEGMSSDHLLRLFSRRNHMVRANARMDALESKQHESALRSIQAAARNRREAEGGVLNVFRIASRDLEGLFKNVMSTVITVGLVALPSLFAWYNILACWNVFDNTDHLSIAVASSDEGYESDLLPMKVNVGEKVVSALRGNEQIHWVFTDPDDAIEGARAGKYYASLVIPENFSRDMLTFYEGDSNSASIDYYVNEKKNAIAPNITGMGADTVSHEVNVAFANTISEVAISVAQSLSKVAQDGNMDERVVSLVEHMRGVADRLDQSARLLGLYSSLGRDSQGLVQNGANAVSSARERLQAAASEIDAEKERLRDLVDGLAESVSVIDASLVDADAAVAHLESRADSMISVTEEEASRISSLIRGKASDIDGKVNDLSSVLAKLEKLRDELKSALEKQIEYDAEHAGPTPEISFEAEVMTESIIILDKDIIVLKKAIAILQEARDACTDAADSLDAGMADVQEKAASLRELVRRVKDNAAAAKQELESILESESSKLESDIATLVYDLEQGTDGLRALDPDLAGTLETVASALGSASMKIDEVDTKLHVAAQKVRHLADAADMALQSGDTEQLRSLLQGNAGDLAAALTAPVKIERTAVFASENFGSSMAPLYCTLAVFIGSLLIMVAMKPEVSRRGREKLVNPKPRHLYFGRFLAVAAVSLMQTTLLGLGNLLFLKVQVASPILFMAGFWFSGLVFAFMIYTLVVAFGNLGKAIAVLLLIVQVTACGGSYPLPMLPDFVQAISPWVPASYVVRILQAAMFGVYHNDFWIAMGHLALFIIPFLLLGLVLRKPLERFMKFYVRKVEECGIMA